MKCPIGCAYCMVHEVPSRRVAWDLRGAESVGLNKAACFLNRRPGGRPLQQWAPLHLLRGETVGFQGTQDPLDPRWEDDLLWLLGRSEVFGGVILTTKWNRISDGVADAISATPNAVLVVSLTGLDQLEPGSTTAQRISIAKAVSSRGGRVHGLVHPWIPGVSSVDWIPAARAAGISGFTVKGLRWARSMGSLGMSDAALKRFVAQEGVELLIDPPDLDSVELPRFQGSETLEGATEAVDTLMTTAFVSSSSTNESVRQAAIRRRVSG